MYLVGMTLFLGFTLGCLFAPTIGVLVAFRGLQGLAGRDMRRLAGGCSAKAFVFLTGQPQVVVVVPEGAVLPQNTAVVVWCRPGGLALD